jgi:hypothetical protein
MAINNLPQTGATVRYSRIPSFVPRTEYQVIAALIWVAGALATELLVRALGCPWGISYLVAVALQWAFTKVEAPMWRQRKNLISLLVLFFDVAVNAAGITPIMERFAATGIWNMAHRLGATNAEMGYGVAVVLAFLLGLLIAAAPEKIWKW